MSKSLNLNPELQKWQCGKCSKWHTELPLDFGYSEPATYASLSSAEKEDAFLNDDFCQVDESYFVRGVLEVPIIGFSDSFRWGVWVSLSKSNFDYTLTHWENEKFEEHNPMFGWLNNRLPLYPDTLELKTNVRLRREVRPSVELEPTDHPLAVEQRSGITLERVQEIAARLLHDVS